MPQNIYILRIDHKWDLDHHQVASSCSPTEANGEWFLHAEINTWIYDEYGRILD